MIVIAESGATKTDWVVIQNKKIEKTFSTVGLNPQSITEKIITDTINNSPLIELKSSIQKIYFYGAGCSSELSKNKVGKSIQNALGDSVEINIEHDLMAAVIALHEEGNPSLTAILGSGSNVCFYDGSKLIDKKVGLGYILADFGCGVHLGKKLIQSFLFGFLPVELTKNFLEKESVDFDTIMHKTYQEPSANRYLASFVPWIYSQKSHPYIENLVLQAFDKFFSMQVKPYEDLNCKNIGFVGSVAFYFEDLLAQVAQKNGYTISKIIKSPLEEIIQKHLK